MRQKNVLIIKGINQYGVLSYMLNGLAEELVNRNAYRVQMCAWDEISQWKNVKWDICFSCQAIDMMFEVEADKYVTWLVDHPVLLEERIKKYKNMDNLWIGCVDRTHVSYLKEYKNFPHVFFLPHYGGKAEKKKAYQERNTEVFFPASYLDVEEFQKEHDTWRKGALKIISDQVIEFLKRNNNTSVEQGIKLVLEQMGETVDANFLTECMDGFGSYIDTYICRYYRNEMVKGLLKEGVSITVVGSGWSDFQEKNQKIENLQILSEAMSYDEVLTHMADSKMVLNVFPWFKNGSHERMASALRNGALCLTDQNQYAESLLTDEVSAVLYDRNNPKELAQKIRYYLTHQEEAERIAEKGKEIAEENMTEKNLADIFLDGLKEE